MYTHVVLGGTFDHLHVGHKDLLKLAFSQGKKVSVGLTKASMNRQKEYVQVIQPYQLREQEIIRFAKSLKRENDLHIIPLTDIFGTTLRDASLDAIIITEHTRTGAEEINRRRGQLELSQLTVVTCPLHADSHGKVISSSRIRAGEIDQTGQIYSDFFVKDIKLSEEKKELLRRPIGKNSGSNKLKKMHDSVIVVGDVATEYCARHQVAFSCAFIDGQSKKKTYHFDPPREYRRQRTTINNPAGIVSASVATFIQENVTANLKIIYEISGEEDLLTLAAVILLPLGTVVVYGYPYYPQSMRAIRITPRAKTRFLAILKA